MGFSLTKNTLKTQNKNVIKYRWSGIRIQFLHGNYISFLYGNLHYNHIFTLQINTHLTNHKGRVFYVQNPLDIFK